MQLRVFRSHQRAVEQREMVESWPMLARVAECTAIAATDSINAGAEPTWTAIQAIAAHAEQITQLRQSGEWSWPFDLERVRDHKLRGLVDAIGRESRGMILEILAVAEPGQASTVGDRLLGAADRCDELRSQILARLRAIA